MYRKIARALLESIYFHVSAVVSLNEAGEILSVNLFSTDYPGDLLRLTKDAREIWLISNHPEGNQTPYEQDICNYRALAGQAGGSTVRLFLSSEYFACFEAKGIGREEACDIMDKTIH